MEAALGEVNTQPYALQRRLGQTMHTTHTYAIIREVTVGAFRRFKSTR